MSNEFDLGGPSAGGRPARRMNSAWGAFGQRSACADRKASFASAEADAWRGAPERADFNRREGPSANGRPARRMNSAWGAFGRRSACADREKIPFASAEADAWRGAPEEADFNRRQRPSAGGRPARRMNSASRGLRPTVGLRRPGRGFASAEADAWRGAPGEGRFQSARGAFGRRSACAPNEFGLQGPSAGGRPAPTENPLLRRRRPTRGAERLRRPISIGERGLWPAVGLHAE
jgi:hypothetical protein